MPVRELSSQERFRRLDWLAAVSAGLPTTPDSTADSGGAVSNAGDVNGSGHDDVIVGAPVYDLMTHGGLAHIYCGGSAGLSVTPDWTVEGNKYHASFGN